MDASVTSISLLLRIRGSRQDEAAWRAFVERYGTRIYGWCLSRGLQTADAEDVTQDVLLRLARHLQNFEYDSRLSFRGWLRRVTQNALNDFAHSRKVDQGIGGSSIVVLMSEAPAREDLAQCLGEAFDLELLDEAKSRVRGRVNDVRWQSWDLTANRQLSGRDVAQQLGISVATVYANKNQIQNLVREEIEQLERQQELHLR